MSKATPEQRAKWRRTAREKELADPERRIRRKQAERLRVAASPVLTAKKRAAERGRRKRVGNARPFVGCDGEGAGTDSLGRQNYYLMRIGERELYTGEPLSTLECLDFICDAPDSKHAILVGFSFGYDVTMILKDLPSARREHLLRDKPQGEGLSRYTYWSGAKRQSDGFGIEYLKNNYFRVCRTKLIRTVVRTPEGGLEPREFPVAVKGSSRTIYETFGFFQTSFLKTLKAWNVGTVDERAEIEANKAERGAVAIDQRQREYCAMECRFLAEIMEQFRAVCLDPQVNIKPRTWNGAGKLSSALHDAHDTITAGALQFRINIMTKGREEEFLKMASAAYYGGRFEVMRTGAIPGPVYEADLHSAYPAAMQSLPCLDHGEWLVAYPEELERLDPARETFVAPLKFRHSEFCRLRRCERVNGYCEACDPQWRQNVCGFPVRQKSGRLFWPIKGGGVYWSCEIAAAKRLGAQVRYAGPGWLYRKNCDCAPFPWVEGLYEARKVLGADMRGYPIKLGINGLYGKLAQRIGNPKYANLPWAGLITALTRAALCHAAALDPESVVMFATDGIFTTRPLPLDLGEGLGQWEVKAHDRLFIVQPGIYWGASRPKMRGVPDSVLTRYVTEFEAAWEDYRKRDQAAGGHHGKTGETDSASESIMASGKERNGRHKGAGKSQQWLPQVDPSRDVVIPLPPVVPVPIRLFTGIKIAQARGKPDTAGVWTENERKFDFSWHAKRGRHEWVGEHVWTFPPAGAADLWSRPHAGDMQLILDLDLEKAELHEQEDIIDLGVPWSET